MAQEKKEPTREERLRKEERRIAKVLRNIPDGKRAAVEKLIREMAYMGPKVGRPPAAQFCPVGQNADGRIENSGAAPC